MGFDSLYTGISALNSYQSWIDNISNNIANASTTGFKGQRMTFADMFYQTQGFASGPSTTSGGVNPRQTGLGVQVATVDSEFAQGGMDTTGINSDLALNGDGFFILRNANGTASPVYTRDGAFSLNSNGLLYDPSSGLAVQGYTADANGSVANSTLGNITIPIGLASQATGTGFGTKTGPTSNDSVFDVELGGNLNQTQWQNEEAGVAAVPSTPGQGQSDTVTTTVYDSLGNGHQLTLTYAPDATGATAAANGLPATVADVNGMTHVPATRWSVTASFADGTEIAGSAAPAQVGYVFFDQNGQYINTAGDLAGTNVHLAGQPTSTADGNQLAITQWGGGDNATPPTTGGAAPLAGPIGLSFANNTSLAASTTSTSSGGSSANVVSQNGYAAGTLSNFTVAQDGTIDGAFTNGQTKVLGQVAVATFQNEDGLSRIGGNQFEQTAASGLAQVGTADSGRFVSTTMQSGSLEESNVSLSDQFTKLIVAQRSFEANTRGIETADQNLQTLIGLRATEN